MLWLVAVIPMVAGVAGTSAYLNRRGGWVPNTLHQWDVATLGAAYSAAIPPLAAFSIALAVFLANVSRTANPRAFENVMALFLMAFIILIGTALMFATTRSAFYGAEENEEVVLSRRTMYVLANLCFYLGLNMSWLGLRPLLQAIELHNLATVFSWLLLFSVMAGAMRQSAWLQCLFGASPIACVSIGLLPIIAVCFYWFGLVSLVPDLWPQNSTLTFAVFVFIVACPPFLVETNVIRFAGNERCITLLSRVGSRLMPAYQGVAVTAMLLLWLSLVVPL
ncbi:MAG TPA: hypothetical protein VI876_04920 [Dehalococcoidia bacterium]|nr:hypothetical protein [Dehalococcoidia bacterium]